MTLVIGLIGYTDFFVLEIFMWILHACLSIIHFFIIYKFIIRQGILQKSD
jgi:hypothetical protein